MRLSRSYWVEPCSSRGDTIEFCCKLPNEFFRCYLWLGGRIDANARRTNHTLGQVPPARARIRSTNDFALRDCYRRDPDSCSVNLLANPRGDESIRSHKSGRDLFGHRPSDSVFRSTRVLFQPMVGESHFAVLFIRRQTKHCRGSVSTANQVLAVHPHARLTAASLRGLSHLPIHRRCLPDDGWCNTIRVKSARKKELVILDESAPLQPHVEITNSNVSGAGEFKHLTVERLTKFVDVSAVAKWNEFVADDKNSIAGIGRECELMTWLQ